MLSVNPAAALLLAHQLRVIEQAWPADAAEPRTKKMRGSTTRAPISSRPASPRYQTHTTPPCRHCGTR